MQSAKYLGKTIGITQACTMLNVSRMTEFRTRKAPSVPNALALHPRALTQDERNNVLKQLSSDAYLDSSPAAAYFTMLDQGQYLASISTFYRILRDNDAVRERRSQSRRTLHAAPQVVARKANEVWSWDICKLLGTGKFQYFHLYVVMDIYSRKVVGWMVAERESGQLAEKLLEACCHREAVAPNTLTIHSDRGPAMMSKPVVALLATLDVAKSVSRPYVSNDNPFSEAHFKTMKYRPSFPKRFGSIQDVRAVLTPFFQWYNHDHRHSGIGYMTPEAVHSGRAEALQSARQRVLEQAYNRRPERFVCGTPKPSPLPNYQTLLG